MLILSVDTSTFAGSVALTRGDEVVAETCLNVPRTHSARLLPAIEKTLADCETGYAQLDGFAVTIGPGSFTGLRISLSVVKGLAYAAHKPLVSVSTLEALAHNLPFCRYQVCPLLDAKKKQVYWGLYRDSGEGMLAEVLGDRLTGPEELAGLIIEPTVFIGEGVKAYGPLLREILKSDALFAPATFHPVRASNVGRLAYGRLRAGDVDDPAALVPRYLRRSDAEIARDRLRDQFG